MTQDREDAIDSASLRMSLGLSLILHDARDIAKAGVCTDAMLRELIAHVEAYESAATEHRTLLFGRAA